jgi:hypothetical protein
VPPAYTLVRWVDEFAFASIVQARPCPTFGRPVHPRGRPHRLRPGTSPHALRIPPHDGHPALRKFQEDGFRSVLAVSDFRLRAQLDFSIPAFFPGQRGITPAFGYSAPHPSARGTLTLLNNALPSAHYEGSDSCHSHLRDRSPHLLQLTFLAFRSQPLGRLSYRFNRHTNVTNDFQASSCTRRLAALPCRIGFVILRTALSLPVALHPISQ